ncbi:MAG TPA: hypothetical protein PK752_16425, partial [Accumulibacter sp.]|uniref:hypothetical protein n=1 Tax=Accumulibacter sp. TaxID=2053492 RepID=UPI002C53C0EC
MLLVRLAWATAAVGCVDAGSLAGLSLLLAAAAAPELAAALPALSLSRPDWGPDVPAGTGAPAPPAGLAGLG